MKLECECTEEEEGGSKTNLSFNCKFYFNLVKDKGNQKHHRTTHRILYTVSTQ